MAAATPAASGASQAVRVIVTRPVRDAAQWVGRFRERRIDALAFPLIEIQALPSEPVIRAWDAVGQYAAVMFVSGNAVEHFFAARPMAGGALPDPLRFMGTGPGTRAALNAAGVPDDRIDTPDPAGAQYDSEHLWQRIGARDWRGRRVLIVRGEGGASRDWLATQWRAAGAEVDALPAYRRCVPVFDAAQQAFIAQAVRPPWLWLFSSAQAIAALPALDWSRARALATHPRVAQAARTAGFGVVRDSQPTLDEIVRSIESMHE